MSQPKAELRTGLLALAEVAIVDLPAAVTLRAFKSEQDGELYKAGWKAYEAATGLVTDLTNRAYANRSLARIGARVSKNVEDSARRRCIRGCIFLRAVAQPRIADGF